MNARHHSTRIASTLRLPALVAVSLVASTLLVACGDAPSSKPPSGSPTPQPMPASSTMDDPATAMGTKPAPPLPIGAEKGPLPSSHPPLSDAKPLVFQVPEGWVKETPSMPMRREQYRLPKKGADTADATVTVSVLAPGDGGGVEGNLQRWAGMFAQPDGSSSRAAMKQTSHKLGDINVIDVDITGTYTVDETAMGGSKKYNEPNWRMLLGWVQAPSGNYYIKVVGPAGTVAAWESSFRQYVDSGKP